MKNKIFKKTSLLVVFMIMLSSCGDDFLDQENPNASLTEDFYKDNAQLARGVVSVYSSMSKRDAVATVLEYERSDITYPSVQRPVPVDREIYYEHSYTNAAPLLTNKWNDLFQGVFRANQVIRGYENLKNTYETEREEDIGRFLNAQARALRGYFYFQLSNSFNKGSVPIIDFVPDDPKNHQQPLASKDAVIEFYRKDLRYGLEHLSQEAQGESRGIISRGACEALLGKSYLYEGKYEVAMEHFKKLIPVDDKGKGDYPYKLTDHIGKNFTSLNEFNTESILEINYTIDIESEQDGEESLHNPISGTIGIRSDGKAVMAPATWLVLAYRTDSIDKKDPVNIAEIITADDGSTETIYKSFSERTSHSVALVDDKNTSFYGGATSAQIPKKNSFGGATAPWFWKKLTNWDIAQDELSISQGIKSGANLRLIRLADIYLMYAECLLEEGNINEARYYINRIRRRSRVKLLGPRDPLSEEKWSGYTFSTDPEVRHDANNDGKTDTVDDALLSYDTKEKLMEHLRNTERPLELSMEGNAIRSIDLRRWKIGKERFKYINSLRFHTAGYLANSNGVHPNKGAGLVFAHNVNEGTDEIPEEASNNMVFINGELVSAIDLYDATKVNYNDVKYIEYTGASNNYDEEINGYLPIPLSELNSNNSIK